jgi:hypothetical protein
MIDKTSEIAMAASAGAGFTEVMSQGQPSWHTLIIGVIAAVIKILPLIIETLVRSKGDAKKEENEDG